MAVMTADPSAYLASRIETGNLDYTAVITRYPQYKTTIDLILIADFTRDIETLKRDYTAVVTQYPQFKEAIDANLIATGFGMLIV